MSMELSGETVIAAPPDVVWAGLTDPALLGRLIPGCEAMTGSPEAGYDLTVAQGVGGLRARLAGRFDLFDVTPGRGCRVRAEGRGGAAGLARGEARVRLRPEGEGTRLGYELRAELGGRLAVLPAILVRAVARRMVDRFLDRFRAELAGAASARLR